MIVVQPPVFQEIKIYGPKFFILSGIVALSVLLRVWVEGRDMMLWLLPVGQLIAAFPLYVWFGAARAPGHGAFRPGLWGWTVLVVGTGLLVGLAIGVFPHSPGTGTEPDRETIILVWIHAVLFAGIADELLYRELPFALFRRHCVLPVFIGAAFSALSAAAALSVMAFPFGFAMGLWMGILRYRGVPLFGRALASGTIMTTVMLLWFHDTATGRETAVVAVFSVIVLLTAVLSALSLLIVLQHEHTRDMVRHLGDAHRRALARGATIQSCGSSLPYARDRLKLREQGRLVALHRRMRILVRSILVGMGVFLAASTVALLLQTGNVAPVSALPEGRVCSECGSDMADEQDEKGFVPGRGPVDGGHQTASHYRGITAKEVSAKD